MYCTEEKCVDQSFLRHKTREILERVRGRIRYLELSLDEGRTIVLRGLVKDRLMRDVVYQVCILSLDTLNIRNEIKIFDEAAME